MAYVRLNDLAGNRRGSNVRGEFQFVGADDRAENGFTVSLFAPEGRLKEAPVLQFLVTPRLTHANQQQQRQR